jgi:hypothetical protein
MRLLILEVFPMKAVSGINVLLGVWLTIAAFALSAQTERSWQRSAPQVLTSLPSAIAVERIEDR